MGRFEKGHKKIGGRQKGSTNKNTKLSKQMIANYFENGGLASLISDISELEAKDKVNAKIKLMEYYIPKLKSVDVNAKVETKDLRTKEEIQNELEALRQLKNAEGWDNTKDGKK